jgi:two-component system chemotaxis sensor kinase CheA
MDEDEEFLRDLLITFREETEEHLRVMSRAVVDLESAESAAGVDAALEILYRQTHSLKGAAGAVGRPVMVSICQGIESVLAALKRHELRPEPAVVDVLSESLDFLQVCLTTDEVGVEQRATIVAGRLASLVEAAPQGSGGWQQPGDTANAGDTRDAGDATDKPAPQPVDTLSTTADTVRVSTTKLESLMLQAEEFISVKLASAQRSAALRSLDARLDVWKREWYQTKTRRDQEELEEFLEWNATFMEGLLADIRMLARSTDEERRSIGPMVDDLLDGMKRVLMLPVSSLLSSFPKMVRDLARSRGKQVELVITGENIEIDKRIIENLKDPLVHLLRNAVDHGIEIPDVRRAHDKALRGTIRVAVSQLENNKIEILVSDDGAGIDVLRLRDAAVREGMRTQLQVDSVDDAEALRLAFASGLSTSPVISQVSGRGLGLAIVEEKVETLGGSVAIESRAGVGTVFRIVVPATLATARGVLAQISDWVFVMPVAGVERVVRVNKADIRMVENRETVQLEGHTLPLMYLHEVLELPLKPQRNGTDHLQVIVAGSGDERVAFAVDRIIEEQEVLVKTLGPQLIRVRNIAGGTIIGSGKVVPIINISDLLLSCRASAVRSSLPVSTLPENGNGRKAVLVVEDSITSRMLLKNLLEAAGYYVRPSVDGLDALAALGEEDFDLVISDIEMPRMDGFELTSKIRSDSRLARMPVMLVTGMETPEDRGRGIDAGANAYVVKSSFTQGTLLETARSLL